MQVWVGKIPIPMANEAAVEAAFAKLGAITTVRVRVKPGIRSSWALVTFEDLAAAAVKTLTLCPLYSRSCCETLTLLPFVFALPSRRRHCLCLVSPLPG